MLKGLQSYCSYQCKDKAARRRKREKKADTSGAWMGRVDKLAGAYYRQQTPFCEAKGKPHSYKKGIFPCTEQLQWCHVFSRRYKGIRYEPYNHLIMCSAHHSYFTYNPEEWAIFMSRNFPEKWIEASENRNLHSDANVDFFKERYEHFKSL